ncbi:MAG TPA: 23S rRNA (uracil(1939)-C(5))-methyltransferase RlmD [Steroidobacteraceae bacterium]|nr:23S rRNA (uracil(1939)-C(5))-methyltransferase RlmD [Steroidobacteraceae bacterium]
MAGISRTLEDLILSIDALDAEGRGVARNPDGKVVFVEGALPGERVAARKISGKRKFDLARATQILGPSPGRREPRCPHFGVCGGCATQHADERTQMAAKQRWLEDNLERIGKVCPESLLPIVYGPEWGYRRRARLSVRRVPSRGGVLVGFRERRSSYIAQMNECHVLPEPVSRLIPEMKALVEKLSVRERVPQIELAIGDNATALVFRHLALLTESDKALLREFSENRGIHVWLQPGGPETAHPLHPAASELYYELPEFGVRIGFRPTDFTQVNHAVNRSLVARAVRLLDPQPGERVADLFCGLGNFSLPLSRRGAQVVGLEGNRELVERARQNAAANGLAAQFEAMDLSKPNLEPYAPFGKILLDPPREGAVEIVKSLPAQWPRRIVYVSCDPATLARDAGILVHTKGFRCAAAGVVNMFPHTAHVESIAWFER